MRIIPCAVFIVRFACLSKSAVDVQLPIYIEQEMY